MACLEPEDRRALEVGVERHRVERREQGQPQDRDDREPSCDSPGDEAGPSSSSVQQAKPGNEAADARGVVSVGAP